MTLHEISHQYQSCMFRFQEILILGMKSLTVVGSAQINSFLIDQGVPIRTVVEKQEFDKAINPCEI